MSRRHTRRSMVAWSSESQDYGTQYGRGYSARLAEAKRTDAPAPAAPAAPVLVPEKLKRRDDSFDDFPRAYTQGARLGAPIIFRTQPPSRTMLEARAAASARRINGG